MEKNTLIAIVLSTIVLITFTVLQTVVFPPKAAEEVVVEQEIPLIEEPVEKQEVSSSPSRDSGKKPGFSTTRSGLGITARTCSAVVFSWAAWIASPAPAALSKP